MLCETLIHQLALMATAAKIIEAEKNLKNGSKMWFNVLNPGVSASLTTNVT